MAGQQATLTFGGDAQALQRAAKQAVEATTGVADSAADGAKKMSDASGESKSLGDKLGNLGAFAGGVTDAMDQFGGSLQSVIDFSRRGEQQALELARAQQAVKQASKDERQAVEDYQQAQEDVNQSVIDGRQAIRNYHQALTDAKRGVVDVESAQIAAEEALLDVTDAQNDLTKAIRENGEGSMEAKRAAIDLKKAQLDGKTAAVDLEDAQGAIAQANIDATQAQQEQRQATRDGVAASLNMEQAMIDQKNATLDMKEALRDANPTGWDKAAKELAAYSGVASSAIGTIGIIVMAITSLTSVTWSWSAAVAIATAPVTLIIIAVLALTAAVVYIATQTTWFQDVWHWAWSNIKEAASSALNWVKNTASSVTDFLTAIPRRVGDAFAAVANFITAPFRAAFNAVSDAWNNTVGRLSWSVPDWIPGIGGNSVSAPRLPKFHSGGRVPGAPGSEMLAILQAGETVLPASGGGAPVQVVIRSDGTHAGELLLALFQSAIEVRGGNVQTVAGGAW